MTFQRTTRLLILIMATAKTAWAQPVDEPKLVFLQPQSGEIFRLGTEVPIMLSAHAPDDVFASAELSANGERFASAVYCCFLCPCAHPSPGITTTLQIPVAQDPGDPPPANPWQGWTFAEPGTYTLTARAIGENGSVLDAPPVIITINPRLNLELQLTVGPDGTLHFRLPEGSMVPGGMALEVSHDLTAWERVGPFSPGNVAAFYTETPDSGDQRPRFYRAVSL